MTSPSDQVAEQQQPPERFVPASMAGELAEAEHLARYRWAAGLVEGRRVLDAACGTAYGSALLRAAGAASVLGVDIAEAVVESARAEMPAGVELRVGDVQDLAFLEDDSFDVVVCFETIEHVRDRDAALDELRRVLAPGGVLAISSPNRDAYVPGNPHHVFEYTPAELREALAGRFGHVALFRQQGLLGCAVLGDGDAADPGAPVPGLGVTVAQPGADGDETYVLALAGDAPLPAVAPVMVTTGLVEVRRWLELYQEQHAALRRQHVHIENLRLREEELGALRLALRDAEQRLAVLPDLEHDARITREEHERLYVLENEVGTLHAQLAEQQAATARAEGVYRSMQASLSWKLTKPLRRLKSR
jgi:SAM-dependent methyltransferase